MNTNGQKNPPGKAKQGMATNPFARALAETEKSAYNSDKSLPLDPFSEALARSGNNLGSPMGEDDFWKKQQQEQLEKKQKQEALRKKLHDQVNPVDTRELFDAREKQVEKEIASLREDLKLLARDIAKFNKSIEVSLMGEVVNPGQDGTYYINFFQQLRSFILMLRQQVNSARTWATQMQGKKRKQSAGLNFEGKGGHEKTKTVYDMMHHEVSNARSGG